MKTRYAILFVLAFIILIPFVVIQPVTVKSKSEMIVVPDDYSTIDEAITNAIQGDTIFVKKGTYHETLKIEKSISLVGEDRDSTIIVGTLKGGVKVPLTINQNNVTATGFTLREGYAGVQLHGNFCKISGNRIINTDHGIILSFGSHNNVSANLVESIKYSGITLAIATSNFIQKNKFTSGGSGIDVSQSSHNNTISENNMEANTDIGIRISESDNNTLFGNNITNCGIGAGINKANNNNFSYNNFVDNAEQFSADEWYALTFGYGGSKNTYDRNFWSDYQSKYPDAKEVDASGIGNTPYVINENNTDYHPLMRQGDISASVPTPTPTTTGFTVGVTPTIIAVIITLSAVVTGTGLLVYFKRRKNKP